MKRRSFIKILAAALLSPFLPSRSRDIPSAVPAIRDPALKPYPMSFTLDQRRRPGRKRPECSHLHDAVRYAMMDYDYYSGRQWSESYIKQMTKYQYKVNKQRSLILNKIIK